MLSSTRSFISSLSIDGSVANMDGNGSAFHLLGVAHSSYQNSQQHKRKCIPFDFTLVLCSGVTCCGDRRIVPLASSTSKARTTVLPLRCVVALVGSSYDRSTP
ncbi:hypothetical protein JHK82_053082 [Glycine max]|nr:hypothetical protein JHK86_052927 [Glycine max]KAG4927301.1 hypothetical protein JHK85_053787 [Glycine max]KAG5082918.1 hypothetical protein JHK84_052956 [Glycine max]KAG5085685.1 hypothetical protein JHK82_053082 [Glycine max]